MTTSLRTWSASVLTVFPRAAGVGVAVTGAVVLAGWALDVPALKGVVPGLAPVAPPTAVFFVLAGSALGLLTGAPPRSARRLLGWAGAAAGCLVAALVILDHARPTGLGLDLLPVSRPGASPRVRMPLATAVASLMLGVALLLLHARRAAWLAELPAVIPAFLCLIAIPWEVVLALWPPPRQVPHSPLPALAYLALSLGALAARPDRGWAAVVASEHLGGVLARRLLPVAVLAPSVLWWSWMLAIRGDLVGTALGGVFYFVANMVVFSAMVLWSAAVLNRIDATRRRAEDEARDRAEQLAEADRRKDEFLAALAHELRNPLAPVLTGLTVLQAPGLDARRGEQTRAMLERQVRHLARLVDDLLDVSRITRGKVRLRPERLDLAGLVRTAAEDRRPAAEMAGLALTVEAPDAPVWVDGDAVRLTQVVANLLDNAAKFTEPGGAVTVTLAADAGRGEAVLSVVDTGVGIEAGDLPRLFRPLAQADRSRDRAGGGLGLGLALVRGLAELHGGSAEARSPGPGRGAEFTVRLPLATGPADGAARPAPPAPAAAAARRVLVVDDNADAARTLSTLLALQGHQTEVAYDGPSALAAAKAGRPEVVLLDLGMPGMDGYEVARQLRAEPALAGVRVVAVTGWGHEDDRRRTRDAGFDAHLVKPVDLDEVERHLAGR
jgi:signal transduction histidine kinase/CheY-like chemotaxis protein